MCNAMCSVHCILIFASQINLANKLTGFEKRKHFVHFEMSVLERCMFPLQNVQSKFKKKWVALRGGITAATMQK